jgi:hypothetical protein
MLVVDVNALQLGLKNTMFERHYHYLTPLLFKKMHAGN